MVKQLLASCYLVAAALGPSSVEAALCDNYKTESTCWGNFDGACSCTWDARKGCFKDEEMCGDGFGTTSVGGGNVCQKRNATTCEVKLLAHEDPDHCWCDLMPGGGCEMACHAGPGKPGDDGAFPSHPSHPKPPCVTIPMHIVEGLREKGIVVQTCEAARRLRRLKGLPAGPPCPNGKPSRRLAQPSPPFHV